MKKKSSLILAMIVMLTLAACGNGNNESASKNDSSASASEPAPAANQPAANEDNLKPEEGATIRWWGNKEDLEWMKFVGDAFTKKYGVAIEYTDQSTVDAFQKLQTDGPAGLGPDLFTSAHNNTGTLAASGVLMENYFTDKYKETFAKEAIEGTSYKGILYGYPLSIETYALLYNKDLVKQVPATMDELIEQSKSFTDAKQNKFGFMMQADDFYYVHAFLAGYGGYVFGNNNTDPSDLSGLNGDGAIKAGNLLQRIHKEILPLSVEDMTFDIISSMFNEGKLMFRIGAPPDLKSIREAGVNFGIVPFPLLETGEHPKTFSNVKSIYQSSYSKYPDAASLLAQYATSEEMLLKRFEMVGQIPAIKSLWESDAIKNNPNVAPFMEQVKYSVPMPNIPANNSMWVPMQQAYNLIWNKNADPKTALDQAVANLKDSLAAAK
ncbi:sugar ABC transporter substrate-binding protein [Paenibacillus lignilyticus]|uniref:Maltodextrin-binding protein n=1 Tax=Paenibacillus lignilyticus TaxID=1172615 RepID=A0ABS5CGM6_9BACL|nr:maltose ABC transporter substrate-binding protein [Paenibacillus lignilyticus]MBP3965031.1 maltose ABC transporter substrate-binding protein [Paenibacillus lignilyticus]